MYFFEFNWKVYIELFHLPPAHTHTHTHSFPVCDYTPLAPVTSTSTTISIMAGDHLVVPIGVSHISLQHKKYNQGSERKEQRTNEGLG